jgi:hypothetical protein
MARKSTTLQVSEPTKKKELTWFQTRFVENYVSNGGNAVRAYAAVPRNDPDSMAATDALANASRMLRFPHVVEAIEIERERLQQVINYKREDAIRLLHAIAHASHEDFTDLYKSHTTIEDYKNLGYKRFALNKIKPSEWGTEITLEPKQWAVNELNKILGIGPRPNTGSVIDNKGRMASTMAKIQRPGRK